MEKRKIPNKIIKSFYVIGVNEKKPQKYDITDIKDEISLRFIQNIDVISVNIKMKNDKYESENEKWIKIPNSTNYWLRYEYIDSYIEPITDLRIHECDFFSDKYLLLPRNLYDIGYRPAKLTKFDNTSNDINDFPKIVHEERSLSQLNDKYVLVPLEMDSKSKLNILNKKKFPILLICRKPIFLPLKEIIVQKNKINQKFQFCVLRHKSPYLYKYLPEILDIYPMKEERNQAVAMFCFPEGVQIKDKFETPKCFNFVLTDQIGERTYGSVLVFNQEISLSFAEAFIPSYEQSNKTYFCQKALCVLSKYPFYYNCLSFLKEIYTISEPNSISEIPIERAICSFVDSLYIPPYNKLLRFNINNKNIDFYRVAKYGKLWDTNDKYLETLFRLLSYEQIVTAWRALLLEKKLYLICPSKSVLSQVSHGLITLLFPFRWIHVYVPVLPEKLKLFIESPVPLIIGIPFPISNDEYPKDGLILDISKNCFINYTEEIPPLPPRLNKLLMNGLNKLKEEYDLDNPQEVEKIILSSEELVLYLGPEDYSFPKIDISELRDVFYNVFVNMFRNYEKYFSWNNKKTDNLIGTENVFLKENFLKDFYSSEENSFLSLFSETILFSQFVDSFMEKNNIKTSFAFFLESIKRGKGKNKYFLENIIPNIIIFAPPINITDLNSRTFRYPEFPKLDSNLFITYEIPKIPYKSKFNYLKDEWCYNTSNLKRKEWPKYFVYLIYDIWFTFFCYVLNIYKDNQAVIMMDYALSLIEYLYQNLKISPTRNLFSKIINSCARSSLNPFIKQLLIMVKNIYKGQSKYYSLFNNDYLNGLYILTENISSHTGQEALNLSKLLKNSLSKSDIKEMEKMDKKIESELNRIIFVTYNLCENCLMKDNIIKTMTFDEILAGFILREDNMTICPNCLYRYKPKIYYFKNNQITLNLNEIDFYSPKNLLKKIDEIIKDNGQIYFYKENDLNNIFLNIVFYFQLFDLPTCVLYVENNIEKFEKLKNILKENKKRKFNKEKKNILQTFFGKINKTTTASDLSSDNNKFGISGRNSKLNDNTYNSSKKINQFPSNIEINIIKNNLRKHKNKENNLSNTIKDISIINEMRNEINLRIKETKTYLSEIINYFNLNHKEKLKNLLEKIKENKINESYFKSGTIYKRQKQIQLSNKKNVNKNYRRNKTVNNNIPKSSLLIRHNTKQRSQNNNQFVNIRITNTMNKININNKGHFNNKRLEKKEKYSNKNNYKKIFNKNLNNNKIIKTLNSTNINITNPSYPSKEQLINYNNLYYHNMTFNFDYINNNNNQIFELNKKESNYIHKNDNNMNIYENNMLKIFNKDNINNTQNKKLQKDFHNNHKYINPKNYNDKSIHYQPKFYKINNNYQPKFNTKSSGNNNYENPKIKKTTE